MTGRIAAARRRIVVQQRAIALVVAQLLFCVRRSCVRMSAVSRRHIWSWHAVRTHLGESQTVGGEIARYFRIAHHDMRASKRSGSRTRCASPMCTAAEMYARAESDQQCSIRVSIIRVGWAFCLFGFVALCLREPQRFRANEFETSCCCAVFEYVSIL